MTLLLSANACMSPKNSYYRTRYDCTKLPFRKLDIVISDKLRAISLKNNY